MTKNNIPIPKFITEYAERIPFPDVLHEVYKAGQLSVLKELMEELERYRDEFGEKGEDWYEKNHQANHVINLIQAKIKELNEGR